MCFLLRVKDGQIEVVQSLKHPYPRKSDEWWLGCTENSLTASLIEQPEKAEVNDGNEGRSKFKIQAFR